ncbi:MAG: AlpA family phage regulatory protein [Pseudomonas sp.]
MLSAREVSDILKMHIKTFYGFLRKPAGETFPKPVIFGKKSHRWRKRDIEQWLAKQVEPAAAPSGD